ncbi:hypothetical protein HYV74_00425 [Candidatus Uhrbacteria bacterium]|nr:hypothetical protein [Candidatus Uhrbacteria bacterium]
MSRTPSFIPEEVRRTPKRAATASAGDKDAFYIPARSDKKVAATPIADPPIAESTAEPAVVPHSVSPPAVSSSTPQPTEVGINTDLHIPAASTMRGEGGGITLIPEELRATATAPPWWPMWVGGIATALAVLLIGGTWFTLSRLIAREWEVVGALETRRDGLRKQLAESERALEPLRATARRATAVTKLLPSHRRWGPVFALIESRTLPGVRYEGLTADVNGTVSMPTVAPSIRAAAEQMVAWKATPKVTETTASGVLSDVDDLGVVRGVKFDLRLRLDPELFRLTSAPQDVRPTGDRRIGE